MSAALPPRWLLSATSSGRCLHVPIYGRTGIHAACNTATRLSEARTDTVLRKENADDLVSHCRHCRSMDPAEVKVLRSLASLVQS